MRKQTVNILIAILIIALSDLFVKPVYAFENGITNPAKSGIPAWIIILVILIVAVNIVVHVCKMSSGQDNRDVWRRQCLRQHQNQQQLHQQQLQQELQQQFIHQQMQEDSRLWHQRRQEEFQHQQWREQINNVNRFDGF